MAKILLVEDDKSLREIYGVRLLAEGYDIVSAGDGEEALAMAIKDRPDLILSDVMMPKISGFDMLDILRSTTETRDVKVIMMTALSSDDQRERGEKLGADRYLVKSQVGIEDVVRTVHEVLGDAPTTTAPNFASTRPNAASGQQPAPSDAPQPPAPQPQGSPQQPVPQPMPAPAAPVQPMVGNPVQPPVAPSQPTPQPALQQPAPAPAASLPQPTAPFSTDRPANFGERVVHPPEHSGEPADAMSSRIEQELSAMEQPAEPAAAPEPQAPAAPIISDDPANIEQELAAALASVSQDQTPAAPAVDAPEQPSTDQMQYAQQPQQPQQNPAPQPQDFPQPPAGGENLN